MNPKGVASIEPIHDGFTEGQAMKRNDCGSSRSRSLVEHGVPVVFLVDNDTSARASLDSLIRCEGWQLSICASATEFLSRSCLTGPGCLILDVTSLDGRGLDVQRLVADQAEIPVILTGAHVDVPTIVRAVKAGVVEFLTKPWTDEQMRGAIRCALEQSRVALSQASQRRELQERYMLLTAREREVMQLVVEGCLNKQIAAELCITEFTVKAHRGRVTRKLGATSVADLIRKADRLGQPISGSINPSVPDGA